MDETNADNQVLYIEPIQYYDDCNECKFRKKCEVKWIGIIPFHVSNGGICPDEFELNINEI